MRLFGFQFDQRGLVSVKGKGQLMTFYLTGKLKSSSQQELAEPSLAAAKAAPTLSSGSPATLSTSADADGNLRHVCLRLHAPTNNHH